MSTTLNFIGDTTCTTYSCASSTECIEWLKEQNIVGLDTETNVVESILQRKLKVISIADEAGEVIWVLEYEFLDPGTRYAICSLLTKKLCIIQNVTFDYKMLLKEGYMLTRVYDTMLGEKILTTGIKKEKGYHGLQAILQRRFNLPISKDEQLSFGEGPYNDDQIEYAAVDTLKLGTIRRLQIAEMKYQDEEIGFADNRGLLKTMWWENEFSLPQGDMEYNGIRIDKDKWFAIEDSIRPTWEEEVKNLNTMVVKDFKDILLDNNYLFEEDTFVEPIWSSATKKLDILNKVFDPPLEKTSAVELKKYLKENDPDFPEGLPLTGKKWNESSYTTMFSSKYAILKLLILATGDLKEEMYEHLNAFLLTNMKSYAIEQGWLVEAGKCIIKWTSPVQRIKIFRAIDPFIPDTKADTLEEYLDRHPIIAHYLKWADVDYQLKSFGKKFYTEHVELDGKHRTRYNPILSTGRLSSVSPNILNIPRKKQVFREAIIPDPGFDFINSDFDGQELVVTGTLAGEETWLDALRNGWDLHSRNADLVFGQEWKDATEEGCQYYAIDKIRASNPPLYHKCSCKEHQRLRDAVKAIGFGLIYGISEFSVAARLDITVDAARALMDKFFEVAPNVEIMMQKFGDYGLEREYIVEPVFGRCRFFEKWKIMNTAEHGSIRRKSYNFPIQASGSALLKIAIVLLRRAINHANLRDDIQILMPYHDEISIQARPKYSTMAAEMLENSMRKAAKLAGFPLLGASAAIGDSWGSSH